MAFIPAIFAAVGTAVGASAATATAVGALTIGGTAAAVGLGISGAKQAAAEKKAANASSAAQQAALTPSAATTVADSSKGDPTALGRAALIATSPQGVLGTDPTGRKRLLGN